MYFSDCISLYMHGEYIVRTTEGCY